MPWNLSIIVLISLTEIFLKILFGWIKISSHPLLERNSCIPTRTWISGNRSRHQGRVVLSTLSSTSVFLNHYLASLILYRISLKCSALYLAQYRITTPHLLASGDGSRSARIIGDVYVHPSAKVHPTAKV